MRGKPWTKKHRAWLGRLAFAEPAHRLLVGEMLDALDQATARRHRLSDHIAELVPNWSLSWLVEALQALRGYQLINATSVVAEVGDPRRFDSPRRLMGFLGAGRQRVLDRRPGAARRITKTGNKRARTTLIEAAWTYAARQAAKPRPPASRRPCTPSPTRPGIA